MDANDIGLDVTSKGEGGMTPKMHSSVFICVCQSMMHSVAHCRPVVPARSS